jgi:BlaI family penicillinase repressor
MSSNGIVDDMSRQKNHNPIGRAELELLQYVHDHHPVTVRIVADHLAASRGIVRTTVLNMMARLVQKRYLVRKRIDGIYQYAPRVGKGQLLKGLVGDFISGPLGGSVSPFVAYLSTEADVTDQELAELRQLLLNLERRKREGNA